MKPSIPLNLAACDLLKTWNHSLNQMYLSLAVTSCALLFTLEFHDTLRSPSSLGPWAACILNSTDWLSLSKRNSQDFFSSNLLGFCIHRYLDYFMLLSPTDLSIALTTINCQGYLPCWSASVLVVFFFSYMLHLHSFSFHVNSEARHAGPLASCLFHLSLIIYSRLLYS